MERVNVYKIKIISGKSAAVTHQQKPKKPYKDWKLSILLNCYACETTIRLSYFIPYNFETNHSIKLTENQNNSSN